MNENILITFAIRMFFCLEILNGFVAMSSIYSTMLSISGRYSTTFGTILNEFIEIDKKY